MNKEQNFFSAVVYIDNEHELTLSFFEKLNSCLDHYFFHYEIIAVNGGNCTQKLQQWVQGSNAPVTIVNMSRNQTPEQSMNAGLDIAIGDYVCEFDTVTYGYNLEIIYEAYSKSLSGYDIVSVSTPHMWGTSKLFYSVFNAHSHTGTEIRTDLFRIVSRRAINRVHSISDNLLYRKAAYAASGLKSTCIILPENPAYVVKQSPSFSFAADSLILYTDFGYRFSLGLSVLMLLITVAEVIYTLVIWGLGIPINGWTTTMFAITFGFSCLLTLQTIIIKYLTLLIALVFRKQEYMIESVQKL